MGGGGTSNTSDGHSPVHNVEQDCYPLWSFRIMGNSYPYKSRHQHQFPCNLSMLFFICLSILRVTSINLNYNFNVLFLNPYMT